MLKNLIITGLVINAIAGTLLRKSHLETTERIEKRLGIIERKIEDVK